MSKFTRFCVILLIGIIAIGIGLSADTAWDQAERSSHPRPYAETVTRYSIQYNIPEYVIYAVIKVESDFEPTAESSMGAMGLMQMMPTTFEWLTGSEHLKEYLPVSALYTPEVSIRYGTYYLNYLRAKFNENGHNWSTVFAAYNGGEGNVAKWLKDPECSDGNGALTYIPNSETRAYVPKVNKAMEMYQKLYYTANEGVST